MFRAVALHLAKISNCATARCQLKFMAGTDDKSVFDKEFAPFVTVAKLKKIKMVEVNKQCKLFTPADLDRYNNLVDRLCFAVRDREIFEMFILVALFDGGGEEMSRLQNGYIGLLHRKIGEKMGDFSFANEDEMDDCKECIVGPPVCASDDLQKFRSRLKEVNELASIMQTIAIL